MYEIVRTLEEPIWFRTIGGRLRAEWTYAISIWMLFDCGRSVRILRRDNARNRFILTYHMVVSGS